MQTVIWSFGAMLIVMLLLAFLPIGLNWKGKVSVGLAAFVLALGGLAALTTFAMWQAGLMVILLVLITAYFMDNRLGALLYPPIQEPYDTEEDVNNETVSLIRKEIKSNALDPLDLASSELVIPKMTAEVVHDDSQSSIEPVIFLEKSLVNEVVEAELPLIVQENNDEPEDNEETQLDEGYLSEIESLIEDADENLGPDQAGWLEDVEVLVEENKQEKSVELLDEENYLEELFDAMEEAAAGNGENKEEKKEKSKIELY